MWERIRKWNTLTKFTIELISNTRTCFAHGRRKLNERRHDVGWLVLHRGKHGLDEYSFIHGVWGGGIAWSRRVNQNDLLGEKQCCKLLPAGSCPLHADVDACVRQDIAREQKWSPLRSCKCRSYWRSPLESVIRSERKVCCEGHSTAVRAAGRGFIFMLCRIGSISCIYFHSKFLSFIYLYSN